MQKGLDRNGSFHPMASTIASSTGRNGAKAMVKKAGYSMDESDHLLPSLDTNDSVSASSTTTAQAIATQTGQPSAPVAGNQGSFFHRSSINFPEAIDHFLAFITANS